MPESLWVCTLPDRTTGAKPPGPGPLRSQDWDVIAKDKISGRGIILHSDSARAYTKKYSRVTQTRVAHCKKFVNGTWTKPFFTKIIKVTYDKKSKHVMAGTQVIDGAWRLLWKGKWGCHGSESSLDMNIPSGGYNGSTGIRARICSRRCANWLRMQHDRPWTLGCGLHRDVLCNDRGRSLGSKKKTIHWWL